MSLPERVPSGTIGIMGGTFDPVHFGHLRLAEEAMDTLNLAKIIWIPAGAPPHRDRPVGAAAHRLAMVKLATAGNPRFIVDSSEIDQASEPSYTVNTLMRLRIRLGTTCSLIFLLGADAFLGLPSWHRWRELFELAHLGVATRSGSQTVVGAALGGALADEFQQRCTQDIRQLEQHAFGFIMPFNMTPLAISASLIRARLLDEKEWGKEGEETSLSRLLPNSVLNYIHYHQLYRSSHGH